MTETIKTITDNDDLSEDFKKWGESMQHTDSREPSPMASRIQRAASRIGSFLERRATNKAHSEALKEYQKIDYSGYIDHLSDVSEDTSNTEAMQYAYGKLAQEEFRSDAIDTLEKAKKITAGFGRAALHGAKETGLVVLGTGAMVAGGVAELGRATERGIQTAGFRADMAFNRFTNDVSSRYAVAKLDREAKRETKARDKQDRREMRRAKIEDLRENISTRFALAKERRETKHKAKQEERAIKRAERKAARTESWNEVRNSASEGWEATKQDFADLKNGIKDKAGNVIRSGEAAVAARRAAGAAALEAYRLTRDTHKEQNSLDKALSAESKEN